MTTTNNSLIDSSKNPSNDSNNEMDTKAMSSNNKNVDHATTTVTATAIDSYKHSNHHQYTNVVGDHNVDDRETELSSRPSNQTTRRSRSRSRSNNRYGRIDSRSNDHRRHHRHHQTTMTNQ